jgi:NADH-quinone oxidoreductase subunit C
VNYQQYETDFGAKMLPSGQDSVAFIQAPAERAAELIRRLKEHEGFAHLVFLTAVDYPEREQFMLSYMLHSYTEKRDICVQVFIRRGAATMESIHRLWAQAATYERELKEMYGIDFPGSPDLDVPFILEGWDDIPPMRRDFDTKQYSEDTYFPRPGRFTKDPETEMREALYPDGERR